MDNNETSVAVKRCAYPKCENTILSDGEFAFCEICRTLTNRNTIAILLDPNSPITDRRDQIFYSSVCNMRPDEIQNAVHKVEWIYLELRKALSRLNIESSRLKSARELQDEAFDIRKHNQRHPAPKAAKTRETKAAKNKSKMESLFGDNVGEILGKVKDLDSDF